MEHVRDFIISTNEPSITNVGWLQPQSDNTYKLYIYGGSGWSPLTPIVLGEGGDGNLRFKLVQEIPDIITSNK